MREKCVPIMRQQGGAAWVRVTIAAKDEQRGVRIRIFIVEEKPIQNGINLNTTSLYISTNTFQATFINIGTMVLRGLRGTITAQRGAMVHSQ